MTREAFIKKWLANPKFPYNEQSKDEMRDDLDKVIDYSKGQRINRATEADEIRMMKEIIQDQKQRVKNLEEFLELIHGASERALGNGKGIDQYTITIDRDTLESFMAWWNFSCAEFKEIDIEDFDEFIRQGKHVKKLDKNNEETNTQQRD